MPVEGATREPGPSCKPGGVRRCRYRPRAARDPPVSAATRAPAATSRRRRRVEPREDRTSRPARTRGFVIPGGNQMAEQTATEEVEEAFEAPERGSADELLDARAGDPLDPMRHSAAHIMAEAVLDLFPGTKLGIGPAIADGFYYDFQLDRPLKPEDLAAIEARMAASIAADHAFVRRELDPAESRAFFEERNQPFKV